MRRCLIPTVFLLLTSTANAQSGLATRQMAVDAKDDAKQARTAWAAHVVAVEAEIDALPPGPDRDLIELEWTAFVVAWTASNNGAFDHIDSAEGLIAAGDAAPNPMIKGLKYAQAVSAANTAKNQMDMLSDDWETFLTGINGTGWSPSSSPPE